MRDPFSFSSIYLTTIHSNIKILNQIESLQKIEF